MTKAVCLLSGGMDSSTALALAIRIYGPTEVTALSFDYGQRHGAKELDAATQIRRHYSVEQTLVDLRTLTSSLRGSALTDRTIPVPDGHYAEESMKATVVPNRNAIMLSIAFGIARAAGARYIYAGMHAGDHAIYPDCRASFVTAFQHAMNEANSDMPLPADSEGPLELVTPFITATKADIVTAGTLLQVPWELTWSCYKGGTLHCGTCGTCYERKEAFELAGVGDPTKYMEPVKA